MRKLIFILALIGCSDDNKATPDAAVTTLTQDCPTYCSAIAAACTGDNQQYSTAATSQNCAKTCALFPVGAATDKSGDTLGCRLYHTQNAAIAGNAALHCPHAGPGGAAVDATTGTCGDNACADFCALEVKVCGTIDAGGANAQYQNQAACMSSCATFTKTPAYSAATTSGNTFACRLYHITNAAVDAPSAATHCKHTGPTPTAACI
jgi:hypothetical protein